MIAAYVMVFIAGLYIGLCFGDHTTRPTDGELRNTSPNKNALVGVGKNPVTTKDNPFKKYQYD